MTKQDFSPIDISGLLKAAPVGDKPCDNTISESKATAVGDQAHVVAESSSTKCVQAELSEKCDSGTVISNDAGVGEIKNETNEGLTNPPNDEQEKGRYIPLFNTKAYSPRCELKREQPYHRLMCIMLAQGYTTTEVAEQTGFQVETVSNLKRQDWAQKLIAEMQQSQGERAIKSILCGAAAEVARKMCETALGNTKAAPAVQLNAQKEVLNRLFGVAPQHIKHEQVSPEDLSSEELRKLIKQN